MTRSTGSRGRARSVWPTAQTALAGVIGHPISHSLSPVMMNAALVASELDAAFLAFDVEPEDLAQVVQAMRAMKAVGLMVTMPHKTAVARLVDELTPRALLLDSVNVLYRSGDRLIGDSTDGAGLVRFLSEILGDGLVDKRYGVVGCGGAGRSIIAALVSEGARVAVANRTNATALDFVSRLDGDVSVVSSTPELRGSDVVINATPVGMVGSDQEGLSVVSDEVLVAAELFIDIVYHPAATPTMQRAQALGTPALNGVGMLVGLGALCFELFFDRPAPVAAMRNAIDLSLGERT